MGDCPKGGSHNPQPTDEKTVVDGKTLTAWDCSKCGEMLGWR